MADFALIALPGAYHSSVGSLLDSYYLARDRVEQVFSGVERVRMETALRIYSQDGGAIRMSHGGTLPVDGALPAETTHTRNGSNGLSRSLGTG